METRRDEGLVSNFAPFLPIFAPFFEGQFLSNLSSKFLPNLAPFLPNLAPFGRKISCPISHLFCLILHLFIAQSRTFFAQSCTFLMCNFCPILHLFCPISMGKPVPKLEELGVTGPKMAHIDFELGVYYSLHNHIASSFSFSFSFS